MIQTIEGIFTLVKKDWKYNFLQKYTHTKVAAHILVDKPFKNCFVCKGIIDAWKSCKNYYATFAEKKNWKIVTQVTIINL